MPSVTLWGMTKEALQALEDWALPLINTLSQTEQQRLRREIARELLRRQRERIDSQRNPDGSPFEKRREQKHQPNQPLRFIYKHSSLGKVPREIRSYRDEGDRLIGYEIEAGGIRTFLKQGIEHHLKPTKAASTSIRSKRGGIRKMFTRMKTKIRALNDPNGVSVGLVGGAARIAEIHQYGLRGDVRPGKSTDYPERQLLGFSDDDVEMIREMILNRLAS